MAETVRTENIAYEQYQPYMHPRKKVSWGAIIAGVVIALVLQLMFSVLGTAIGLTYIEPEAKDVSTKAAMVVSLFWWLITWLISLFLGSIIAGKLSGAWSRCSTSLHGLVVWAVSVILTIMFLTSAVGTIIGGAFSVIGSGVQAVTSTVGKVAPGIAEKAQQMMPQTELGQITKDVNEVITDPNQRGPLMDALKKLFSGEGSKEENKQAVVDILVKSGNMTEAEAQQKVDNWEQSFTQTKEQVKQKAKEVIPEVNEKATQVAGKAADIGATAAWFAFVMLLLGAIVSILGGLLGKSCCCDDTERKETKRESTEKKVPE